MSTHLTGLGNALYRVRRRYAPDLDGHTTLITIVGAVAFILTVYHARPHQLAEYFPTFERSLPIDRGLAWHFYSQLAFFAFLFILPAAALKWPLRERLSQYGLRLRGAGTEIRVALLIFLAVLPVLWVASLSDAFQQKYPKLRSAESDLIVFVCFEAGYLVKWFAWEFFFRGFLLFGFEKRLGNHAILVTTLAFVIAHIGKPEAEMFGAVVSGLVLGALALRSRSIAPGVILHFLVAGTMDLLCSPWAPP